MIEEVNEQHLLYSLLVALVDDIGGVVKLSAEHIKKIIEEKKYKLDLYEEENDIFIELIEEENENQGKKIE